MAVAQLLSVEANMKELIPAIATGITFPPQLEENKQRKGPFDVFTGGIEEYYNEYFKYSRFNTTWVDSGAIGDCYINGSCTGVLENLRAGKADLTMHPILIDFPPGFNITRNFPVYVGPMWNDVQILFASGPYQSAYRLNSDILVTFREAPWLFNFLLVLVLIVIHALLNATFKVRNNKLFLAHGEKFPLVNVHGMLMKQLLMPVKLPHRVVSIIVIRTFTSFMLIALACMFKSNMVYEHPPTYYSSIEDIVERVHNKSVIGIEGLIVDSKLIHRKGTIFERMGKIFQAQKRDFLEISQQLVKGRILIAPDSVVATAHGLLCSKGLEEYLKIRRSQFVYKGYSYTVFSPNSSRRVIERFSRLSQLYLESGIYDHYNLRVIAAYALATLTGNPFRLHFCLSVESMMKWPSSDFSAFSYIHFAPVFNIMLYSYVLSLVINICELLFKRQGKK